MQRWDVLRRPRPDRGNWQLPDRLLLIWGRQQCNVHRVPSRHFPGRCRAAVVFPVHTWQFLRCLRPLCRRRFVPAWKLLS
jgi:hypothetical protein